MEADTLGMVTAQDEIYAERRQGDWILVRLADMPQQEAWMLVCTADQQLLVPVDEPVAPAAAAAAPPQYAAVAAPQFAQPAAQTFAPSAPAFGGAPFNLGMSANLGQQMRTFACRCC